ncbi:MerR family transcriptional regulator [Enterococcus sp. BWR-S5]|uniref:MerR family transcriptional regulator n=1 Tax=Enterococcus sp. BWR-S5 TaxID=2787714 RepID=UPI0019246A7E|nr:MerR family transcriptional regulator [Enterococcus sp. BWR-S5]MBL1225878.1 MerR family transcriptional regulator [Enterococcus sp. BWR-S5]
MYTVNDVSERLNLSKHTIRYYTDQGLIPNLQRDKNNNRIFDDASLNWLIGVRYLKNCGMSIQDIREYNQLCLLGDSTIDERFDIILKQKALAEEQLLEAQKRYKYLEDKLELYEKIKNRQHTDTANPDKWPINQVTV